MKKAAIRSTLVAIVIAAFATTTAFAGPPAGKMPIFPLAKKAGFTTLAKAVEVAGLQKTLTADGPFTVFAPTDEAFAAVPAETLEFLLNNPEELKKVLLYHVVAGKFLAADVLGLTSAPSVLGPDIQIDTTGGVFLNGDSEVIETDVMAKNGVVHVINKVLIPPGF
jgi:uncharacterized surface protein with fasciclin (FAS1) repeats